MRRAPPPAAPATAAAYYTLAWMHRTPFSVIDFVRTVLVQPDKLGRVVVELTQGRRSELRVHRGCGCKGVGTERNQERRRRRSPAVAREFYNYYLVVVRACTYAV